MPRLLIDEFYHSPMTPGQRWHRRAAQRHLCRVCCRALPDEWTKTRCPECREKHKIECKKANEKRRARAQEAQAYV